MKIRIIALGLSTMMSAVACAGAPTAEQPAAGRDDLSGRAYLATEIRENGKPREPVAGTSIELTFTTDGELGAYAGCNHISAALQTGGGHLTLGATASTEMFCEGASQQEKWLTDFLSSGPAWQLEGDELVLTTENTVIRLLDREVAEPDLPLTGTRWRVDTIVTGEAASTVPVGAAAFITIDKNGALTGSTGCNTMSAPVRVTADQFVVDAVTTTRKGCAEDVAALERAVLATLKQTVSYRIDGAGLTLTGPAGAGLHLRADR